MARKMKKSGTAARLEAEARALGKNFDALIVQARKAEAGARANAMRQSFE